MNKYFNDINKINMACKTNAEIGTDNDCAVCYEDMSDNYAKLKCGHSFCISCFVSHTRVNNNCPLCRDEFCEKPKNKKVMCELVMGYFIDNIMLYVNDEIIFNQFKRMIMNPDSYYEKEYEVNIVNGVNVRKLKRSKGLERVVRIKNLYSQAMKSVVTRTMTSVNVWYDE